MIVSTIVSNLDQVQNLARKVHMNSFYKQNIDREEKDRSYDKLKWVRSEVVIDGKRQVVAYPEKLNPYEYSDSS